MMTDDEKIRRLAAILGIEGAVQYGAYHGYGERSHKRGWRVARLASYEGDGATDADARLALARTMERSAEHLPRATRDGAMYARQDAARARSREAVARAEAERYDADAASREAEAAALDAHFGSYLADCAHESAT